MFLVAPMPPQDCSVHAPGSELLHTDPVPVQSAVTQGADVSMVDAGEWKSMSVFTIGDKSSANTVGSATSVLCSEARLPSTALYELAIEKTRHNKLRCVTA
jgi:hypothetical protein